jgi:dienelactone hydrolase
VVSSGLGIRIPVLNASTEQDLDGAFASLGKFILVHGSGGIGGNVDRWSQELNSIGLATFVTDSFTARGIQSTSANQGLLGRLNMILDSYRALGVLAAHPRIDPEKVVLMGFSRGGQATLYASLKRFERMYGPEGATFAAYVPFYAPCFTTYIGDEDVSEKPIRLFHGADDDRLTQTHRSCTDTQGPSSSMCCEGNSL